MKKNYFQTIVIGGKRSFWKQTYCYGFIYRQSLRSLVGSVLAYLDISIKFKTQARRYFQQK